MINYPNLLSDNFEEDISPTELNNNEKEIKLVDITYNDDENSKLADIDKQRAIIPK